MTTLKDAPGLWVDFVPLAFHVDYWDYIGWSDRFARPAYSQRQRNYARSNALSTVYTPGFVVNGKEWRGWFKREPLPLKAEPAGILRLSYADKSLTLDYSGIGAASMTAHVALLGAHLVTEVRAGENKGRNLKHDFVVLTMQNQMMSDTGQNGRRATFTAFQSVNGHTPAAVAAWVTKKGDSAPIQAVGGWLDEF